MRETDSFDADALLTELGVEIPWPTTQKKAKEVGCGEKAPAQRRHTEWNNNESFLFGGYVARVVRLTCRCCGGKTETLEGIFTVEVKVGTGARRLQALGEKTEWPMAGGHTMEVQEASAQYCVGCVRVLGFDREVGPAGTMNDIVIR